MAKRAGWLAAVAVLLSGAGVAQVGSAVPRDEAVSEPDAEIRSLVETCAGHKFETIVSVAPGRGSKVKICGEPGQTVAEWVVTLKDSIAKTQANAAMAPDQREKIVAALRAEVARLEGESALATANQAASDAPIKLPNEPVAARERAPEYSSLPELPTPKRPARANLTGKAGGTASDAPAVVPPNLTVLCGLPGETYEPCKRLQKDTRLMVRAEADVASATLLRFVRDGEQRAELDLGAPKKGAVQRYKLPTRLCSDVFRGKVQLQLVTTGRVAATHGPYTLSCRP